MLVKTNKLNNTFFITNKYYHYWNFFFKSCTSTSNKVAIFTSVAKSGCATFEHHLDTVDGFLPNCSANHLLVRFFSTSTI